MWQEANFLKHKPAILTNSSLDPSACSSAVSLVSLSKFNRVTQEFQAVHGLGLHISIAGDPRSIPGEGTRLLEAVQPKKQTNV